MSTVLGVIGLAIAAAGTAYSVVSSGDQQEEAKKQSREQQAQAAKLTKDFEDEQTNLKSSEAGKAAREKQKERAIAAQGRRSTLLTGPTGISGDPSGGKKTLLGL